MDLTTTEREGSEVMNVFYKPCDAVNDWKRESAVLLDVVKNLLRSSNYGTKRSLRNWNYSLKSSGFFAGYTPLHIACLHSQEELVKKLIEDHQVDVNVTADDGAQPIHLACLVETPNNLRKLLENNANVDLELSRSLFSKYRNSEDWYDDFGDKMTLLAFTTVYRLKKIIRIMIDFEANVEIKSIANKTLLMYAFEADPYIGVIFSFFFYNRDLMVNARDNYGYSAIHYMFHPKNDGNYWKRRQTSINYYQQITNYLIRNNADIYATVNNDPMTLPLNMAAYRSYSSMLMELLPCYQYLTKSKALYYATLPLEDLQALLDVNTCQPTFSQLKWLETQRHLSVRMIVEDLIFRLTFNLFVPKAEHQLLDKLISTDPKIREIVHNYKQNFIEKRLKTEKIPFEDESITYYDFAMKCCDRRQLRLIVKNQVLMRAFINKEFQRSWHELCLEFKRNCDHYDTLLDTRIKNAQKRIELLERLKNVELLRKVVPLPYELVLETVQYLDNYDLENFMNAFPIKLSSKNRRKRQPYKVYSN